MTYNPPFLYRCKYDDGQFIDQEFIFGEAGIEAFYNRCIAEAAAIPGARIVIEYYDRRRRKWRPVVQYTNKGGDNNAPYR